MGLPHILKNFDTFVDGSNFIGKIPEVALGKIAEKVEAYRGGGMLGEVDVAMGLDKLEVEIKAGGPVRELISHFGKVGVGATVFRFVGAYQEDVAGGVQAGELVVRGRMPEIDPGTAKIGEKSEWSHKLTASYVKWTLGGVKLVELDWMNAIFVVDGVDRYAEIRAALGWNGL